MVCVDTACALAEADVGKGWRVGWRSQRGLFADREWCVLGARTLETRRVNSARQRGLERRGRRGIERLKAGGVEGMSLECLKDCRLIRCRRKGGERVSRRVERWCC